MKIFFDTEFIEDGKTIDLISIGMIKENGDTYYAESSDCDYTKASDWVVNNVFPHMNLPYTWKGRYTIRQEILEFVGNDPEFWAYFADYDWVVLCQLFGKMIDLPKGWPMFCMDVKQYQVMRNIPILPIMKGNAHNALDDAIWCKEAFDFLSNY